MDTGTWISLGAFAVALAGLLVTISIRLTQRHQSREAFIEPKWLSGGVHPAIVLTNIGAHTARDITLRLLTKDGEDSPARLVDERLLPVPFLRSGQDATIPFFLGWTMDLSGAETTWHDGRRGVQSSTTALYKRQPT